MAFWNKTKIIATIGPASATRRVLRAMLLAGADVIRINGAHGTPQDHRRCIALVRDASARLGHNTAILVDLPGPKYRVGRLTREPIELKAGEGVALACGRKVQTDDSIPVPHDIHRALKPGNRIFINDGIVELAVVKVAGSTVRCRVKAGGEIRSNKGINLPGVKLDAPSLTEKDHAILSMAIRHHVDYVGLSFVRSSRDIIALRSILKRRAPHTGVVAKIEKPEAIDDLDNIIDSSDAIMVARGDLGIEVPFDQIPLIQRYILARCLVKGKPSITATQMLESMISSARPTRAEATDVAGAVWEGSDAVMLSEETSMGKNPALAVRAMARIALDAEREMPELPQAQDPTDPQALQAQVLGRAAGYVADCLSARAIVAPTRSGRTPLSISRNRPSVPVLALAEDARAARRMALYWGVRPVSMPKFRTVDELLRHAERAALKSGFIKRGDTIVIVSGAHGRKGDITRLVEVRRV